MKRTHCKNSIFVCLVLIVLISGCGIKANPQRRVSMSDYGQMIKDMQAVSADGAVLLKWNYLDTAGKINLINIEKSEVGSAGNECKDCPRTFERLSQIKIKDVVKDSQVSQTMTYTDRKVVQGRTYNYRLILCDDGGICKETSATEINYR